MENSSEDTFTEVRIKNAEDLEEILECPICFELPQGIIGQCINGHHICSSCKDMLMSTGYNCPTCQCSFGSSRNYAAEKLCEKLEDIKNLILKSHSHESNRRIKKRSVEVQTELACKCLADEENNSSLDTTELIAVSKHKIPKIELNNSTTDNNQNKRANEISK